MFPYLLIAFFNIAFNHNALDKGIQISRVAAAVKHFFYNADLLLVLLVGVGVVSVYNAGRIYQIPFHVKLMKQHQILVVVVGQALAMFADSTPQDGVCPGIAFCFYLPVPHNKLVAVLGSMNGIEHNGQIAAGRIFHAYRNMTAAGNKTVLLVFHGAGPYSNIGHNVIQVADIVRIQHFISSGKTGFH